MVPLYTSTRISDFSSVQCETLVSGRIFPNGRPPPPPPSLLLRPVSCQSCAGACGGATGPVAAAVAAVAAAAAAAAASAAAAAAAAAGTVGSAAVLLKPIAFCCGSAAVAGFSYFCVHVGGLN